MNPIEEQERKDQERQEQIKIRKEAILRSLTQGASRAAAARDANVSRRTFYNWLEDEDFERRVEDAEQEAVEHVEEVAYRCAMKAEHDPRYIRALIFYLCNKAGWSTGNARVSPQGYPWPDKREPVFNDDVLAAATQLLDLAMSEASSTPHHHPATPPPPHSGDGASRPAEPRAQPENPDKDVQSAPSESSGDSSSKIDPSRITAHPRMNINTDGTPENTDKPVQSVPLRTDGNKKGANPSGSAPNLD